RFFFQAEDGIRDFHVTGVQTCALPIYAHLREALQHSLAVLPDRQTEALYERCLAGLQTTGPAFVGRALELAQLTAWLEAMNDDRSEERRVGKEGRSGRSAHQEKRQGAG